MKSRVGLARLFGALLMVGILAFAIHPISAATSSSNVAIIGSPGVINGGGFLTSGGDFDAFSFTNLAPASVNSANLASFDTVLLNVASTEMGCTTATLTAAAKSALVDFVADGKKLIIYDSECTPAGGVDYSWLPYPFTTNNPGAAGAQGTLTIVEENTLSSANNASPYYVDAPNLGSQTDAVGDMNVMVTLDPAWCKDMSGTNINDVTGPVHTYAAYGSAGSRGLIIYNGLDVDYMGNEPSPPAPNGLSKIWLLELQQPFSPDNLPCTTPVVPHGVGGTVDFYGGTADTMVGYWAIGTGLGLLSLFVVGWMVRRRLLRAR